MSKIIDIFLISGFLGAGKTTFLKRMLTSFANKRIGVIVNEFGEVNVDGKLLERDGIEVLEISNGSIFCSCLKGSFIQALVTFTKQPINILIVENSGLADPSSIRTILNNVNAMTKNVYDYKGAICVVDGTNFLDYADILTPIQNQVISSNFILLNKIDKVPEEKLCLSEEKIKEINPNAVIIRTTFSQIDFDVLPNNLSNEYIGKTSNTPWSRPDTYTIEIENTLSRADMAEFLKSISEYTYRIKGLLQLIDGNYQVDCVGEEVQINLTDKVLKESSKLIVISKEENDIGEVLKAIWREKFQTEMIVT